MNKELFKRLLATAVLFMSSVHAMAAEGVTEIDSFGDVLAAGGIALKIILVLSAATVFLVIYFILSFRSSVLLPTGFLEQASEAAREGDVDALRSACRNSNSAGSKVMLAAAEQMAVTGRTDYLAIRDAVEDEGGRQANALWQRLQYLMDIAAVAPMVGLLGTVFGMLQSFMSAEVDVGVRALSLSQGVAKALITTAGGLIVGIAALILYAVFRGRVALIVARFEDQCGLMLRQLVASASGGRSESD
jgi:biopolymer transport protein ExbB